MHAGLLRPDSVEAPGFHEARQVAREIAALGEIGQRQGDVALVMDYPSAWAWEIQPQGREFDYFRLVFDFYKALRALGLSIDIKSSRDADFSGYRLVIAPGLFAWPQGLPDALARSGAKVLIGPRSGSKTQDFSIPPSLPPGLRSDILDCEGCPLSKRFRPMRRSCSRTRRVRSRSGANLSRRVRPAKCCRRRWTVTRCCFGRKLHALSRRLARR